MERGDAVNMSVPPGDRRAGPGKRELSHTKKTAMKAPAVKMTRGRGFYKLLISMVLCFVRKRKLGERHHVK